MTTDEAIAAIKRILDDHAPGSYVNGQKMIDFLKDAAEAEDDALSDDMSSRQD